MGNYSQYKNISKLIIRDFFGVITDEELDQLNNWKREKREHSELYHQLFSHLKFKRYEQELDVFDPGKGWEEFVKLVKSEKRRVIRLNFLKYAAIFLIPLLIAGIIYKEFLVPEELGQYQFVSNIEPGTQKAELVLHNGDKIDLENQAEFAISEQGMIIQKNESVLNYKQEQTPDVTEVAYNTINIPRGGEYVLILSDGTRVFLNSMTSFKYPVNFKGNKREVELVGEAYFEVTRNKHMPFVVKTPNSDVEVLGTSFNLKAYNDEQKVTTTLVEGEVKVKSQNQKAIILSPGEQSVFNTESNKVVKAKVNTMLYTSWKDGKLLFENQRLEDIMATLERWYDAKVFYMNPEVKDYRFGGNINKYDKIDPILEIISLTDKVNISVKDKTIVFYAKK